MPLAGPLSEATADPNEARELPEFSKLSEPNELSKLSNLYELSEPYELPKLSKLTWTVNVVPRPW